MIIYKLAVFGNFLTNPRWPPCMIPICNAVFSLSLTIWGESYFKNIIKKNGAHIL